MSMKFDAEEMLDNVLDIMTGSSALNNKISAIEAEKTAVGKGLTPTLAQIDSGSYYEQTWSKKILNTNPSIFYGIEDVNVLESEGSSILKKYNVFVEVIMIDSGQTNDVNKRINRYSRALEELFAESFAPAIAHGKVKINTVRPIAFALSNDSDDEIKVGGVSLTMNLA